MSPSNYLNVVREKRAERDKALSKAHTLDLITQGVYLQATGMRTRDEICFVKTELRQLRTL